MLCTNHQVSTIPKPLVSGTYLGAVNERSECYCTLYFLMNDVSELATRKQAHIILPERLRSGPPQRIQYVEISEGSLK